MPLKILIIANHPIIKFGLKEIIGEIPGYDVIEIDELERRSLDLLSKQEFDIAIVDLPMSDQSSPIDFALIEDISRNSPASEFIILTASDNPIALRKLDSLQPSGMVSKSDPLSCISEALGAISIGKRYHSPTVRKHLAIF
ncbi:hypothetical protein Y5A_018585 [Burkholderia glumae AU6208]|nr:hypothetical protein Y5A_018585 [Burkholderia glumae AU6208]